MPTSKPHATFVADGQLEFEFYLADKLKMTVSELRARMGNQEFVQWNVYHALKQQEREREMAKAEHRAHRRH